MKFYFIIILVIVVVVDNNIIITDADTGPDTTMEWTVNLSDSYAIVGKPFTMTCTVTSDVPLTTNLTYHWRHDNADVLTDNNVLSNVENGTLYFKQVTESNFGVYTCVVSAGQTVVETKAFLRKAYVSRTISRRPAEQSVKRGNTVNFHCIVDAKPEPTVTWNHNGKELTRNNMNNPGLTTNRESGNYTLQFNVTSYDQAGDYQCVIHHMLLVDGMTSDAMTLVVIGGPVITTGLKSSMVAPHGYNITLPCLANSNPDSNVTWIFEPSSSSTSSTSSTNSSVTPPTTITLSKMSTTSIGQSNLALYEKGDTLHITNTSEGINGVFTCVWTNSYGSMNSTSSIIFRDIPQAPTFLTSPKDYHIINVTESSTLRLDCNGTGNPSVDVSWVLPTGCIIKSVCEDVRGGGIFIKNDVKRDDAGVYVCVLRNSEGVNSMNMTVNVLYKPYFVSIPENITVDESSEIKLFCKAEGNPNPTVMWKFPWMNKEVSTLSKNSVSGVVFANESVVIKRANGQQHGSYSCTATNGVGAVSVSVVVKVLRRPRVVKSPTSVGVVEGDEVLMECVVDSYPLPSDVTWYFKYLPDPSLQAVNMQELTAMLSSGDFHTISNIQLKKLFPKESSNVSSTKLIETFVKRAGESKSIFMLKVFNARSNNAGVYICHFENERGSSHGFGFMRVITYPAIEIEPVVTKVVPGENVLLHCRTTGIPIPAQKWLFNGIRLNSNPRIVLSGNGSLLISDIRKDEVGKYTCLANNQAGQKSRTAEVLLSSKPYFTNPPTNKTLLEFHNGFLSCSGDSERNISYTVFWYSSDSQGGQIKLLGKIVVEDNPNVGQMLSNNITLAPFVINDGSLYFGCVERSHETWYMCELTNEDGYIKSDSVFLSVETVPSKVSVRKTPESDPEDGGKVDLICSVEGVKSLHVTWISPHRIEISSTGNSFYPEISVDANNNSDRGSNTIVTISTLKIDKVYNKQHGGEWWCKMCNSAGCSVEKTILSVRGKPALRHISATKNDKEIAIQCIAFGQPKPDVFYSVNGTLVTNKTADHIVVNRTMKTDIHNHRNYLNNDYSCHAINIYGNDTKPFGVPQEVTIANIIPMVTSLDMSINVKSSHTDPHLTEVIIEYKLTKGDSWNSKTLSLPKPFSKMFDVFDNVILDKAIGDKTCGNSAGDKNTPSRVQDNLIGMEMSVASVDTSFLVYSFHSASVDNLNAYSEYSLRVRISNVLGTSDPSDIVTISTLSTAPSVITNMKFKIVNRSFTLSWSNPDKMNGDPQDIDIKIDILHHSDIISLFKTKTIPSTSSPSTAVFQKLPLGDFTAEMTAINSKINVSGKTMSFKFTVRDQPPHFVPEILQVKSVTSNSFTVNWKVPSDPSTLTPPVTGFVIALRPTDPGSSSSQDIQIIGGNMSTSTMTKLRENEEYTVRIASRNEAGIGEFSSPMRVTTRYEPFSKMALGPSYLGYSISWKLIAIIIIACTAAIIGFVAFLVFSYQLKLSRSRWIDITSESSDVKYSNTRSNHNHKNRMEEMRTDADVSSNSSILLY